MADISFRCIRYVCGCWRRLLLVAGGSPSKLAASVLVFFFFFSFFFSNPHLDIDMIACVISIELIITKTKQNESPMVQKTRSHRIHYSNHFIDFNLFFIVFFNWNFSFLLAVQWLNVFLSWMSHYYRYTNVPQGHRSLKNRSRNGVTTLPGVGSRSTPESSNWILRVKVTTKPWRPLMTSVGDLW